MACGYRELWKHTGEGGPSDGGVGHWGDAFEKKEYELEKRQPLGSWRSELLAFGEAVQAGSLADRTGSVTSGADGLATVAAMEAVLQAVDVGGLVKPSYTLD